MHDFSLHIHKHRKKEADISLTDLTVLLGWDTFFGLLGLKYLNFYIRQLSRH